MSTFLGHAVTVGDVLLFGAGWLTLSGVRWWRRNVAWQHTGADFRAVRSTPPLPRTTDSEGA